MSVSYTVHKSPKKLYYYISSLYGNSVVVRVKICKRKMRNEDYEKVVFFFHN